ncbi:MAG: hypothetical protein NC037_02920 [Bacteroides sp.]|nr:hypothetical protein [Bacillota bacterium]MCM1393835.1 hypothetical protein [[Eubacterium] siraeum]MCM1455466.1 hypothetical protein [Bacteroides sp.]
MSENSPIYDLFTAQKDVLKTIKDTPKMKELFDMSLPLDRKIREKLAPYPQSIEVYNELEQVQLNYLSETEFNAYNHGFKAGLMLAIECGLHAEN